MRRGLLSDLVGGAVLFATWLLLWSIFVFGVVGPAARFRADAVSAAGSTSRSDGKAALSSAAGSEQHERSRS